MPSKPKSSQFPAFLFYPEDFAAGTGDMAPIEVGVYIRCLCYQWSKGSIPDDAAKVGRISGATPDEMAQAWAAVKSKFDPIGDGLLANARLESVRQELIATSRKRSRSGKAGAKSRWNDGEQYDEDDTEANADPLANEWQNDSKDMASRVGDGNEDGTSFSVLWEIWPSRRRQAKGKAWKAWKAAILKASPLEIIRAAREYAASPVGQGEFVKQPSTWLNQKCWFDDRAAWQQQQPQGGPTGPVDLSEGM